MGLCAAVGGWTSGAVFQEGSCRQGPTLLHSTMVSALALAVLDIPILSAKAGGSWVLLVSWCQQPLGALRPFRGQIFCWVGKPGSASVGRQAGGSAPAPLGTSGTLYVFAVL